MPDKGTIPMGFRPGELWVMGYWRIMGFPPYTNSGMAKSYGVSEVMGYQEHGLRGCRLYIASIDCSRWRHRRRINGPVFAGFRDRGRTHEQAYPSRVIWLTTMRLWKDFCVRKQVKLQSIDEAYHPIQSHNTQLWFEFSAAE
ncbi:hypothetical protein K466DRAFT_408018, partial [Polyporus arcularius HHB13444]